MSLAYENARAFFRNRPLSENFLFCWRNKLEHFFGRQLLTKAKYLIFGKRIRKKLGKSAWNYLCYFRLMLFSAYLILLRFVLLDGPHCNLWSHLMWHLDFGLYTWSFGWSINTIRSYRWMKSDFQLMMDLPSVWVSTYYNTYFALTFLVFWPFAMLITKTPF